MTRQIARSRAAAITVLLAGLVLLGGLAAAPAEATSYRFWAYWLGSDDGWSFSSQGASRVPADGTVDGWRFAISEASSSTIPPRHTTSFARICGSTEPVDGSKRVGVVVDFGTTADAPEGESPPAMMTACVVAEPGANGYDVLTEVVQIRTDAGLICGMDGYPATECGAPVADPGPSPSNSPSGTGGGRGGTPDTSAGGDGSSGGGQGVQRSGDAESSTTDADRDSGGTNDARRKTNGDKADEPSSPATPDPPVDVSPAAAAAAATTSPGAGSPAGLVAGLGIVAALLTAAVVLRRRRP